MWQSGRLYRSGGEVEFQMSGVHQVVEKRWADEPTQGLDKGDECKRHRCSDTEPGGGGEIWGGQWWLEQTALILCSGGGCCGSGKFTRGGV